MRTLTSVLLLLALEQPPAAAQTPPELIETADRSMAAAAVSRNQEEFLSHLADDAFFLGGVHAFARTRDAVGQMWSGFFRPDGPLISWTPQEVVMSRANDMGVSTGDFQIELIDLQGNPQTSYGKYLTVWKWTKGRFLVVLDGPQGESPPEGADRTPLVQYESVDQDLRCDGGTWELGDARGSYITVQQGAGKNWKTLFDVSVSVASTP